MEGDVITLQSLFEFKLDRIEADRTVVGRLHPTGLRPGFVGKFERHGIELSPALFGEVETAMFGIHGNGNGAAWVYNGESR